MTITRSADVKRHVKTVHSPRSSKVLDDSHVPKEEIEKYREKHRLWCKSCGVIFTQADSRRRHESHGSCDRSQASRDARRQNDTTHG